MALRPGPAFLLSHSKVWPYGTIALMLLWGRAIFVSPKPQGGCAEEEVAGLGGISREIQWEGLHRAGAQAWSACLEVHQVGLLTLVYDAVWATSHGDVISPATIFHREIGWERVC